MQKHFYVGTKRYEFVYEKDANDPNIASELTFTDEEQVRVKYYYPYIKKGDVVFDIGASFGSYTLPALAIGAKVWAWSPEHELDLIEKNIKLNGYKHFDQWVVFGSGLYSKKGYFKTDTTDFTEEDRRKENEGNWTGWWIQVETLDYVVDINKTEIDRVDYLKIDTEGAELEVLKGGIQTVKKYKPKMLLELHLFKDGNIALKLIEFLKPLGYKIHIEQYTNAVSHMFCY